MIIQDYKVSQNTSGVFDLIIDSTNKVFKSVSGLDTAIDFQLFTDKRSTKQDITTARSRQGWIGDILTKQNGYEVGSFIYLKNQSRNTTLDLNETAGFAKDCLKYFIAIGAAKNVNANVSNGNIFGTIKIDGDTTLQYSSLWKNTGVNNAIS
jgi:phage gp46-like protein